MRVNGMNITLFHWSQLACAKTSLRFGNNRRIKCMKKQFIIMALFGAILSGAWSSVVAKGLTKSLLENATALAPDMEGDGTHSLKFKNGSHNNGSGIDRILYTAVGDLNGDNVDDGAIVFYEDWGGTGAFMRMSVFLCKNGKPIQIGFRSLGDRSKTESLKIAQRTLTLDIRTHGPIDPASNPTRRKIFKYRVQTNKLLGPEVE
jgi:hypothetical protein